MHGGELVCPRAFHAIQGASARRLRGELYSPSSRFRGTLVLLVELQVSA